jgi:small subunit ribosomal protein S4e
MHQTRRGIPTTWPIPKKGTKYVAVASNSKTKAIPLVIVLRDLLKIGKTRREVRQILLDNNVSVNHKVRKNGKFPVKYLDVVQLKGGKNYRMVIENKKFGLKEEKNVESKIVKIVGKISLNNKRVQMNLEDGTNTLAKEKFSVGDSAVLSLKDNKVLRVLSLKEGAKVEIVSGKHVGAVGKIKAERKLERETRYLVQLDKMEVELPQKTLQVIE